MSFGRRMAALLYDLIAVLTVLYFAAFVPVLVAGSALNAGNPLFTLYLLIVMFGYFWVSWVRGRTLGMQAWKLSIQTSAGGRPQLRHCALRFAAAALSAALFGLGYLAALFDAEHRTWHDRASSTRLVHTAV